MAEEKNKETDEQKQQEDKQKCNHVYCERTISVRGPCKATAENLIF